MTYCILFWDIKTTVYLLGFLWPWG